MNEEKLEQASQWLVVFADGSARHSDRVAFEAWLSEDKDHAIAFAHVARVWGHLPHSEHLQTLAKRRQTQQELHSQWWRMRWSLKPVALCTLALVVFVLQWLRPESVNFDTLVFETKIGEVKTVTLSDGTKVTLGAGARLITAYDEEYRRTRLERGEAYFNVTKDPKYPFLVALDNTQVRVLGTEFELQRQGRNVSLNVAEGKVEFRDKQGAYYGRAITRQVGKGQHVAYTPNQGLSQVEGIEIDNIGSWREFRFNFDNQSLANIIKRLNQYYSPGIKMEESVHVNEPLTASFKLTQLDAFLQGIAVTYGLYLQEEQGRYTLRSN